MCGTDTLSKFYEREAQADLDAREMVKLGWTVVATLWSQAARKWRVDYRLPLASITMGRVV